LIATARNVTEGVNEMIVVRIIMNVFPDKQLEVMQTLLSMIGPVEKEAGCLSHSVFCDIRDENCFCLVEAWQSREDLNRHFTSHRFGALLGTKTLLCEPLEIQIHTVSKSEGMEIVHAARSKTLKPLSNNMERNPIR
jgi:quinol monooxygenase YgiN